MAFGFNRRDWIHIALSTVAVFAIGSGMMLRWFQVAMDESNSPGWHSRSSAEARKNGVFVSRPVIADSVVASDGGPFLILDAWVEEREHVESRLLFFRKRVRDGRRTLFVVARPPTPDRSFELQQIVWHAGSRSADTVRFEGFTGSSQRWISMRTQPEPLPDTLRLIARSRY